MLTFEYADDVHQASMGKVLVVDDEQIIVKYLHRCLSKINVEVFTALNGKEGLKILESEPIDIVIADFRMPEMDGVEFLKIVKKNFKKVSRILLSGYMAQSSVVKALSQGIATTYFSKPWDDAVLISRINHILEIQKILRNKQLLDLINSIDKLPTLPSLYQEFMEAMEQDKPINEISEIIKKNTSVATKVLQVANSAFYGLNETTSIDYAMVYIGLNPIKDIVLTLTLTSDMNWDKTQVNYLKDIFQHSTIVNRYVSQFYYFRSNAIKFKPFPAVGITHDIGKIILLQYYPERYESIMQHQKQHPEQSFYDSEIALGFQYNTHAEIGAYFLDWWNLPAIITEAALFHHTPEIASEQYKDILDTTHFTDKLINHVWRRRDAANIELTPFVNEHISVEFLTKMVQNIQEEMNEHYNI